MMKYESVGAIQLDLVTIVSSILKDSKDFWDKNMILQHQDILELVSFFFEDYRDEFNRLMAQRYSYQPFEGQQNLETVIFMSWCSQKAFQELREIELPMVDQGLRRVPLYDFSSSYPAQYSSSKKLDSYNKGGQVNKIVDGVQNLLKRVKKN